MIPDLRQQVLKLIVTILSLLKRYGRYGFEKFQLPVNYGHHNGGKVSYFSNSDHLLHGEAGLFCWPRSSIQLEDRHF